ncbi:N-formylglutamate amidohydrolase [Roseovarius carneus]|uniref:N-formylglutamate amidohydrolase n=1 Tax=Roseovarius carneus TaxID=2853164 RepID=UPI001CCDF98F|nr:N-formylglutamate amidohydrolase [Roseovarius carneus]
MTGALTAPGDPIAVEWVHPESKSEVLLLCEHAGQAIPKRLGGLGLPEGALDRHIGWDIGAERLARALADRLGAPLIIQRYSRLVLDCNRPAGSAGSIPEVSDGIAVPGNQGISDQDRAARQEMIFDPLNAAIDQGFAHVPRRAAFSIHSYTRRMQDGVRRTWDAGFLSRHDLVTAQTFVDSISGLEPGLVLGVNQPYQIEADSDWFIPHHAERRGMRHTLVEVCNDQLGTDAQVARWADLLAHAVGEILAAP